MFLAGWKCVCPVCAGDRRWKGVCALNGEVVSVVHPTRWECVCESVYVCVHLAGGALGFS